MSEVKSNAAADKALSEMWAQQLISQRRASEALPILRKHFNDATATAELRRELEEVKAKAVSYAKEVRECRRNWDRKTQEAVDATKENLALKREVEELRDKLRRAEKTIDELNQAWIDQNI